MSNKTTITTSPMLLSPVVQQQTIQHHNLSKVNKSKKRKPPPPPSPPSPPYRPCKIYVIDPSKEFAPALKLPQCNLEQAWPFDKSGSGVDGWDVTPHWAARHAFGHWVSQIIRNSSIYRTDNIKEADLWYLDTHCYALWHESLWHAAQRNISAPPFDPFNNISMTISRLAVDGMMAMKYFTRTAGRRFIISRPTAGSPPGGLMDTCARLKRSFILASERAVFCDNDRDRAAKGDSLILPLVVAQGVDVTQSTLSTSNPPRDTLMYHHSRCPVRLGINNFSSKNTNIVEELRHGASLAGEPSMLGQRLLVAMHDEIGNNSKLQPPPNTHQDINITCIENNEPSQHDVLHGMKRSVFCPVMASGSQATRTLPSAALSGCIPVFFGPPFHSMPLAGDIDYKSIAIFINITDSGKEPDPETEEDALRPKPPGDLEPNAGLFDTPLLPFSDNSTDKFIIKQIPTFKDAVEYLRSQPKSKIDSMQRALDVERRKFYYPPATESSPSILGDIIMRRMCEYSNKLDVTIAIQQADRAQRLDKLPKITDIIGKNL